jgi:hypothetical protein
MKEGEEDMVHRAGEPAGAVIGHPAVPMLDLQQFCSTEQFRFNLHKPFSFGEFSYGCDGRIAIRVARREDVKETEQPKVAETLNKWLAPLEALAFESAAPILPDDQEVITQEDCEECKGRGTDHDCPECQCTCDVCAGSGVETSVEEISVVAFGRIFRLKYLRTVLQLPGIEIASLGEALAPVLFRFDGGCGVLMPRSRKAARHIEIASSKD